MHEALVADCRDNAARIAAFAQNVEGSKQKYAPELRLSFARCDTERAEDARVPLAGDPVEPCVG